MRKFWILQNVITTITSRVYRTLDRRLREFEIYFSEKSISVGNVENAVIGGLEGLAALLGYRAMQKGLLNDYVTYRGWVGLNVFDDVAQRKTRGMSRT